MAARVSRIPILIGGYGIVGGALTALFPLGLWFRGWPDDTRSVTSIHQFQAYDIDGNFVKLDQYKGKLTLIVNVASSSSLADKNYRQLVELQEKYKDHLAVLAFPSNQFAHAEPGSSRLIKEFANKYNVQFDMFKKIKCNGENADELFKFLRGEKGGLVRNEIKWNFTKFLTDADGVPIARYSPLRNPMGRIEKDIQKLVAKME